MNRAGLALGLLCLAFTAESAFADPVVYDVGSFSAPGYSASWLHTAVSHSATMPDGNTYWMGGHKTHRLDGEITADRDLGSGLLTFTGGTLEADSLGKSGLLLGVFDQSLDIEIEVTGGSFLTTGGRPGGYLETVFRQGATDEIVNLYFAPLHYSGPANSYLDPDMLSFAIWGNNAVVFPSGQTSLDPAMRIGADVHATGVVGVTHTPEPGTIVLVGALLSGAAAARRRRKRARN